MSRLMDQILWWVTEQFQNETELQNAIELILQSEGVTYVREYKAVAKGNKSRVDFALFDKHYSTIGLYLEAKIDTKSSSFDRAIGQALRNAVQNYYKTWVILPDDVKLAEWHLRPLQAIGCDVVRISDLAKRISGFRAHDPIHKDFNHLNNEKAKYEPIKDKGLLTARHCTQSHVDKYFAIGNRRRSEQRAREAQTCKEFGLKVPVWLR